MDLFDKCYDFKLVDDCKAKGLYPYFHEITSRQHSEVQMDGHRTIMLGSNNYLGLTSDDRVIAAAQQAAGQFGSGCSGSRFLNGTLSLHTQLERELAQFFGKEAVMTFPSGFQTNLGILSSIVGRHDVMFFDRTNHASLIDGARLSFGKLLKYDHNNMDQLEELLAKCPENRGKLIVVDGVFSMEGDLADLPNITRLAEKYHARVMVDDSHGIGTLGKHGRGVGEYFGLEDKIDILMGTFSKSFASLGGFFASREKVIDFARHTSRPFIFAASMPAANVAAVREALHILQQEPERVVRVQENAEYMRQGFRRLRIPHGDSTAPIIPVNTYDDDRTFLITRALLDHGVFVNPVVSPAVAKGQSILRTSYTATQTKDQLDYALEQFDLVFNRLYPISDEEVAALQNAPAAAEPEDNPYL
ncbi:MAG: aminotransferase class I/II-fold pyridoxal phosphate-dependent enzyme [Acutalibacteraceae bacterium]